MNSLTTNAMKNLLLSFLCLSIQIATAQQSPAREQEKTIAIVGATAHVGNGEVIENSALIFKEGKITSSVFLEQYLCS